jgi:hypothetical protein
LGDHALYFRELLPFFTLVTSAKGDEFGFLKQASESEGGEES